MVTLTSSPSCVPPRQYPVDQKAFYLIGRNAAVCDLVLQHLSISRLHAAVVHHEQGATYLVDLRSAHGTFVDGLRLTPLQPTLVAHGATIKFGGSSRSYAFKAFESREQIAERVAATIGLDAAERALQQNTLLNAQIAHRLELSPSLRAALPELGGPLHPPALMLDPLADRRSSADDVSSIAGPLLPARKRSRGQSANSQTSGSSDASLKSSSTLDLCDDEPHDETQGEPKRVHFVQSPPVIIPDTPRCGGDMADALGDDMDVPVTPRELPVGGEEDNGPDGDAMEVVVPPDADGQ